MDHQNRKHPSLPDHHPENQEEMLLSPQNHRPLPRLLRKERLFLQSSIHFPVKTPIKKLVPGKSLLLYKYIVLSFPDPSLRSMQWQQFQLRYLLLHHLRLLCFLLPYLLLSCLSLHYFPLPGHPRSHPRHLPLLHKYLRSASLHGSF